MSTDQRVAVLRCATGEARTTSATRAQRRELLVSAQVSISMAAGFLTERGHSGTFPTPAVGHFKGFLLRRGSSA